VSPASERNEGHGKAGYVCFPHSLVGVLTSMSVGTSVRSRSARVATVAASRRRSDERWRRIRHPDVWIRLGLCLAAALIMWAVSGRGIGHFLTAAAISRHGCGCTYAFGSSQGRELSGHLKLARRSFPAANR